MQQVGLKKAVAEGKMSQEQMDRAVEQMEKGCAKSEKKAEM